MRRISHPTRRVKTWQPQVRPAVDDDKNKGPERIEQNAENILAGRAENYSPPEAISAVKLNL